jgi:hypothetical protein
MINKDRFISCPNVFPSVSFPIIQFSLSMGGMEDEKDNDVRVTMHGREEE